MLIRFPRNKKFPLTLNPLDDFGYLQTHYNLIPLKLWSGHKSSRNIPCVLNFFGYSRRIGGETTAASAVTAYLQDYSPFPLLPWPVSTHPSSQPYPQTTLTLASNILFSLQACLRWQAIVSTWPQYAIPSFSKFQKWLRTWRVTCGGAYCFWLIVQQISLPQF